MLEIPYRLDVMWTGYLCLKVASEHVWSSDEPDMVRMHVISPYFPLTLYWMLFL